MKTAMHDVSEIEEEKTVTNDVHRQEIRRPDGRGLGLRKTEREIEMATKRKRINVQIQEIGSKVKTLEVHLFLFLLFLAADNIDFKVAVTEDLSGGYINVALDCSDSALLWCQFLDILQYYKHAGMKRVVENWIVTMEGQQGWDDYLLLATFSTTVPS
jgi:hypothetical protein